MIYLIGLPSSGKSFLTKIYIYFNIINYIDGDQCFNSLYYFNTENLMISYGLERLFRLIERSIYILVIYKYKLICLGGSSYIYFIVLKLLIYLKINIILINKLFIGNRQYRNIFNLIKYNYISIERKVYYTFLNNRYLNND